MEDKVFKIEKVIHRFDKYEVYAICEFMHAGKLFAVNKKVRHTCFKCNHKFQDDDFTNNKAEKDAESLVPHMNQP